MGKDNFKLEMEEGRRFGFGKNWSKYLRVLNNSRILSAEKSLKDMLNLVSLEGKTFLDVGSGSGLFSLAARKLGANVSSFDYDPDSVVCTQNLKMTIKEDDQNWSVERGSILDREYLKKYNNQDIVYSWGVLHHTGNMWKALENISDIPKHNGGYLFIAIYNDQNLLSKYWLLIKKIYNKNILFRWIIIIMHTPYLYLLRIGVRIIKNELDVDRGMSIWRDMIDWLGGYPFEVAKPEEIFLYFHKKGYKLTNIKTCGGRMGCNEFVFIRK
ncbi:MAG: class I SAM-dependent methyltransferase [Gammaproteobacteria bacterium]|nr:class I SAM-dependent methyltransferase [Gammaproteobacteria bacterium]